MDKMNNLEMAAEMAAGLVVVWLALVWLGLALSVLVYQLQLE